MSTRRAKWPRSSSRIYGDAAQLSPHPRSAAAADGPADAAIVGDEAAVTEQIEAMFAAGATDMWAAIFPVGDDREGSRRRTRALLQELARS